MTSVFLVSPSTRTGNNRRVELAGMDLWVEERIDNVYVYPSEISIDQLKDALSRTLSLWPIVAGRIRLENDKQYIIEMRDNSIPITLVANNDMKEWPLDSNVIVDASDTLFPTFIDLVSVSKILESSCDEPLVRLKLTHIVQSNEWVLGISWYHLLGDAAACLHFSSTLSRFYQRLEPTQPLPIFERRLWREDEADQSVFPIPKQFQNSLSVEENLKIFLVYQQNFDPLNLHFSGEQLDRLRELAGGKSVSINDALTAYIALTLNMHCYRTNDERRILHTVIIVNCRSISDSIARQGEVSNALFMLLSEDFENPYSLSTIAKTIRRALIRIRDPALIVPAIAQIDCIMRENTKYKRLPDAQLVPNELVVNSNFKFDWAGLVDFGFTDQCRFYTAWSNALYLRVFRLNPQKNGNTWLERDRNGAEVSFRIEKELKDNFLNAWKQDVSNNFQNIPA